MDKQIIINCIVIAINSMAIGLGVLAAMRAKRMEKEMQTELQEWEEVKAGLQRAVTEYDMEVSALKKEIDDFSNRETIH